MNTSFKGLSPLFDLFKGGGGEGGYPHRYQGRGIGGVFSGRGIRKTPYVIMGGVCVSLDYTSKVIRTYQHDMMTDVNNLLGQ